MEDPSPLQIFDWFNNGSGRLVAGALLWVVVLGSKKAPWLKERLTERWQIRTYTLSMALLPGVAAAIVSAMPMRDVVITAFTSFGGATMLNTMLTDLWPKLSNAKPGEWAVIIGQAALDQVEARQKARELELALKNDQLRAREMALKLAENKAANEAQL